jgi:hypothetical protein
MQDNDAARRSLCDLKQANPLLLQSNIPAVLTMRRAHHDC